ncbi:uncharacterized protein LOC116137663, partial [Pistacia vera]|uniref:uncharacterized protein LOC116137663 n=1 Tax=Pistacia vera TaxID=55513 RepID=UPI001263DB2B
MEIDGAKVQVSQSLIDKIYNVFSDGMHFAAPVSSLRMSEVDLVRGVLQMFQGFSSSLFYWDQSGQKFRAKTGIYVTHLSLKSLYVLLNQFTYGATCLKLVEIAVGRVETFTRVTSPTLRAFSCSVSEWLKRLRNIALKEEMKVCEPNVGISTTLLGLANSLSSYAPNSMARFVVEKNSLMVTSPEKIKGSHDSAIGNFGIPQYGGSMAGTVVYPKENQKGCKGFDQFRIKFESKPGALPNFVLVDRG